MLVIESAGLTDVGQKRKGNEDSHCLEDRIKLYVVADGMGGHKAGEVASRLVVETIRQDLNEQDGLVEGPPALDEGPIRSLVARRLDAAIHHANQIVFTTSRSDPAYEGMGATVSVVQFTDTRMFVANVGDSPVYLIRDGRIVLQSTLHTFMAEQEALAPQGARKLGEQFRHMLTRAVGTKETVQPDIRETPSQPGDTIVISSDGLTDMVKPEEILKVVTRVNPQRACRLLVDLANKRGGNDNITVIVIRVKQVSESTAGPAMPETAGSATATPAAPPLRVDFDTDEDSHQGLVRRLDAGEVIIDTAEPFSEEQSIMLNFPLPEGAGSLSVTGRVAGRDSQGITVQFAPALSEAQKNALSALFR